MDEPTQEQTREFWERCGLRKDGNFWYNPKGKQLSEQTPPVDLNNLFQLAVPKTKNKTYLAMWIICLIEDWAMGKDTDPALALFWALRNTFSKGDNRDMGTPEDIAAERAFTPPTLTAMLRISLKMEPINDLQAQAIEDTLNTIKATFKDWLRTVGLSWQISEESTRQLLITLVDEP